MASLAATERAITTTRARGPKVPQNDDFEWSKKGLVKVLLPAPPSHTHAVHKSPGIFGKF